MSPANGDGMGEAGSPIVVVGLVGSLRGGSHTRQAVRVALGGAEELGAEARLIDLRDYDLPFCDGEGAAESADAPRLRAEVARAHGVILGTPEYHGGFSGVLKNALDLIDPSEMKGKMVGLVGTSGGSTGAIHALIGLRNVGRTLHAWVIPDQVSIAEAYKAFDEEGRPKDAKLEARLKAVGRQVARFAYLHHSARAMEFLRAWEASAGVGG